MYEKEKRKESVGVDVSTSQSKIFKKCKREDSP